MGMQNSFSYLSEDEKAKAVDEMEKEGLFDKAIKALKTSASWVWVTPKPEKVHFRVAELYKKKGDVVQAAMTRRWHGIPAFSAKYLKQGRCPLPDSLGILQRHLWYRTCYLADGSEHEKSRQ